MKGLAVVRCAKERAGKTLRHVALAKVKGEWSK